MAESVSVALLSPEQVARQAATRRSGNGIAFAAFGDTHLDLHDLDRLVEAVPVSIARSIERSAYFFVPLAMAREGTAALAAAENPTSSSSHPADDTLVASVYTSELSERSTCHRNVLLGETDAVFISTRLLSDRFALSFEFFIHIGHAFADAAGIPAPFADLVWKQALAGTRGETSQDASELRTTALAVHTGVPSDPAGTSSGEPAPSPERARAEYLSAAFADALAIYLLSLTVDFDYSELREREYPLLAPAALAERLRLVASLHPPNPKYEFSIRYRRRA